MTDAMFKQIVPGPTNTPPGRVYLDFYKLAEAPFAITPDPEFLFSASCHQQVLDNLGYAIDGRMGFVLLTGEVGTGKTTLCRTLLDRLIGKAESVYLINPSVSGHELLASILEDLGAKPEPQASKKALIDQLNQRLLSNRTNRPFVVIIDDAQTMTPETLEDLRLLSNLETDKRKLVQVVLSGQPELLDKLSDVGLRQLKQRIAVHCRLTPLSVQETGEYISRRLFVAGNKGQVSFSHAATRLVHKMSGGIPRLINKICEFALTAGYVKDASVIDPSHVKRALAELDGLDFRAIRKGGRTQRYGLSAAAMLLIVLIAVLYFTDRSGALPPVTPILNVSRAIDEDLRSSPAPGPLVPDAGSPVLFPLASEPPQPAEKKKATGEIAATAIPDTQSNAVRPELDEKKPARPQPAPYALQLGSFRTLENTMRGVAQYWKKEVPANWQMVGNGRWYRIVTGKFESLKQAARYKTDHGLKKAMIILAPWTVRVMPQQPDISEADIRRFLSEIGYDSLMQTGIAGDNEIYTGLFMSVEDASITAERINNSGRLLAQVVTR